MAPERPDLVPKCRKSNYVFEMERKSLNLFPLCKRFFNNGKTTWKRGIEGHKFTRKWNKCCRYQNEIKITENGLKYGAGYMGRNIEKGRNLPRQVRSSYTDRTGTFGSAHFILLFGANP